MNTSKVFFGHAELHEWSIRAGCWPDQIVARRANGVTRCVKVLTTFC